MRLEGEERQTHVGEDKVLCQEVQQLKQLKGMRKADIEFHLYMLLPQFLHFLLFETVKNFQNILAHHKMTTLEDPEFRRGHLKNACHIF